MANVLLTSTAPPDKPSRPYPYDELHRMKRSASRDKFGVHAVTDDPAAADIILYVENCDPIQHYFEVRRDRYYRQYPDRCFLFSRNDLPVPFLPGIYASMPARWYDPRRTRTGPYLNAFDHSFIPDDAPFNHVDILYSFVGQRTTHPLREALFDLDHPDQFLFDTAPYWPYGDLEPAQRDRLEHQYVDTMRRSQFVLCPRGRGASSIRLFESLRMGRAPVIISDAWVPPAGPDWNAFSVRVPESQVSRIPVLLAERESDAKEMGQRARAVWEDWFSESATFHRSVEWCLEIQHARNLPERMLRFSVVPQLMRPTYFKELVRHLLPRRVKSLVTDSS